MCAPMTNAVQGLHGESDDQTASQQSERIRRARRRLPGGRGVRLTAVGVATALAVAGGVVACGRVNLKQEADAAAASLASAKVVSFTLHLDDPKNSLASGHTSADDAKTLAMLRDSAISITVDPAGDTSFGDAMKPPTSTVQDPAAALKHSGAIDVTYTHAGKSVVAFRMDGGVLYLHIDPAQIQAITGQPLPLDQLTGPDAPPGFAPVAEGLKSGKWLSLDLSSLYERIVKLGGSTGFGGLGDTQALGGNLGEIRSKILAAVSANTTTTSSAGPDGAVLIAVKVNARAAVQGVLDALAGLPGPAAAELASARAQLAQVPDGTLDGTVTIKDGHYTRVAVDLHSLAVLSKDADAMKGTVGTELVVDVNDRATPITAPNGDQVVQLDTLADAMVGPLLQMGPSGLAALAH